MADKGIHIPHQRHKTCGLCRHPSMSGTRKQMRETPFPKQRTGEQEKKKDV